MREITYTSSDADFSRILASIESDIEHKMDTVGKSADMHMRAHVHTHCAHLERIAGEIRRLLCS